MIVETHLQNTQPITQATTSWPGQFFIKNLFAEFNRSNIRYAVMRNYQNLPGSTDGSDLDIIVHPVNKNIAKKIIFDVINRSNGVPIGHVNMPGFLKIFVLGFLKEEEKEILWWGIRLDISFGLIFKGATNLMEWREDQIISHNEVRVLSDSLANVLGVLKEVLNNNQLPKRYLDSARNAVAVDIGYLIYSSCVIMPKVLLVDPLYVYRGMRLLSHICAEVCLSCEKNSRSMVWNEISIVVMTHISRLSRSSIRGYLIGIAGRLFFAALKINKKLSIR